MTNKHALLGFWAETSIHAGAGSSVSGIDLPIQREAHSHWPCVYGSGVKGALRAKAEQKLGEGCKQSLDFIFGSETAEHAGALLVGDARLILLPVRSLTSHFKWVTCPALLERLRRDATRLGITLNFVIPEPEAEHAFQVASTVANDYLFLEEYRYKLKKIDKPDDLVNSLHSLSGIDKDHLNKQLVIVDNDQFNYLSRYATPVTTHIAIDNTHKTVKPGALWYEESLPAETVLYCLLSASKARVKEGSVEAEQILNCITVDLLGASSPYLQIGGNETVGMGWCKVQVFNQEACQ